MKVTSEKLHLFNQGLLETTTLTETVSVDFNILLPAIYPSLSKDFNEIGGIVKKMVAAATEIVAHKGLDELPFLINHQSDIVRGWGAYIIGLSPYSLEDSLELVRPLADDRNSGVKEWAWLALRKKVAGDIEQAIDFLLKWTREESANLRRFASEITRPRGVWSAHISQLRKKPELAIDLLQALNQDQAKYVQNSVGNWLNDAGKDNAFWVQELCGQWQKLNNLHTNKIIKRALRNIKH
jgi:3-methyladenine DNA glycosylase AlkC